MDMSTHEIATVEGSIARILRDHLSIDVESPESDLLATGLLDSLGVVDLLIQIETELGVAIPMHNLDFADIRSVRSIAAMVVRRKSA
jgi:acyl carrier protein